MTHQVGCGGELPTGHLVVAVQRDPRPNLDVLDVSGTDPGEPSAAADVVGGDVRRAVLGDAAAMIAGAPVGMGDFAAGEPGHRAHAHRLPALCSSRIFS